MNTIGQILRLTTAGESHGPALVGILDGLPAGQRIDFERVALEMSRRRPGQPLGTARREDDRVEFLSGLLDGVTLGTPVAYIIYNKDTRSADYDLLQHTFRPNHADYTYQAKYGIRDHRGGGRSSARETALRVAAGAVALQILERQGMTVTAYASRIGSAALGNKYADYSDKDIYASKVYCPDSIVSGQMVKELEAARREGDTLGGTVSCVITGLPAGLGEPLYGKFQARLAEAMMSINAAHGFEYGDGFDAASMRGSESLDTFTVADDGRVTTAANHSGGVQGGITNGRPVTMTVAFKPIATLMRPLESINQKGETIVIPPRGRHDVSAVPRAVAVVKAMAALTALDAILLARTGRI